MKKKISLRAWMAFTHDVIAACFSWMLAYLLRFNFEVSAAIFSAILQTLPWVVLCQASCFFYFGLYRGIWRFASIPDLKRIMWAVVVGAMAVAACLPFLHFSAIVPRSVLVLDPLLLILMMGGSRFAYRAWKEHHLIRFSQLSGEPVLVVGAGEAAIALLKELERSPQWRVVGLLDDKASLHGFHIHGVPVLGSLDQLARFSSQMGVQQIIVALPSATHQLRQKIVHVATDAGLTVLTIPSFNDLMSGKVSVSSIRKVEVEDLLGREPVMLDDTGLKDMIERRVILVTGAGGSIGSELCRQIARYKPSILVLFEISEYALYRLEQEFAQQYPELHFSCMVGDVKDAARMDAVLQHYRPSVVFHAAAYKHVPMMENGNAGEALRNNALGTWTVAQACIAHHVQKFVLISTDKAVNPTNVMGATKRLAEMLCQGLQGTGTTRLLMVRFGNVLGSSGSVIPKFREQIAAGGPVTVTHPEITRYFMSIPEAAQLVMQAGLMGQGGEIFVLDMGESVRIADLAREMIRLSGLSEDDIKISYTGLRPGEKLYEELLADDEHTLPTPHPKLRIAQARTVDAQWVGEVVEWIKGSALDEHHVKSKLCEWVGEYQPAQHTEAGIAMMPASMAIH